MKRTVLYSTLLVTLVFFGGCNKQENDADGIRAAITQHLASLKTLNLSAMDMNVMSFTVHDSQAQAQVEFRRRGAPQGAGMQVEYSLSRQDGKWTVQSSLNRPEERSQTPGPAKILTRTQQPPRREIFRTSATWSMGNPEIRFLPATRR